MPNPIFNRRVLAIFPKFMMANYDNNSKSINKVFIKIYFIVWQPKNLETQITPIVLRKNRCLVRNYLITNCGTYRSPIRKLHGNLLQLQI